MDAVAAAISFDKHKRPLFDFRGAVSDAEVARESITKVVSDGAYAHAACPPHPGTASRALAALRLRGVSLRFYTEMSRARQIAEEGCLRIAFCGKSDRVRTPEQAGLRPN
jgi:hypothetical protein